MTVMVSHYAKKDYLRYIPKYFSNNKQQKSSWSDGYMYVEDIKPQANAKINSYRTN